MIVENLAAISAISKHGTVILLSGILRENEQVLKEAILTAGLNYNGTKHKGDWILVTAEN